MSESSPPAPQNPPPLASAFGEGLVKRRTLDTIRWVALIGQAVAILTVDFWLGFELPLLAALALILLSALVNLASTLNQRRRQWLDERSASFFLAFDLLQLGALLALTGGLINPFAVLILAPVTVSASLLPTRATTLLASLAVAILVGLAFWHLPLPWKESGLAVEPLYLLGLWVALGLATVFIATYVASLAEQRRRLGCALAQTQAVLAREQRLAALGGLAASTAHELGSPLSTIAVVTHELLRELPADSPLRADLVLLKEESDRCKQLLSDLSRRPEADGGLPFNRLPASALLELAAERFASPRAQLTIEATPSEGGVDDEPELPRDPELLHGLGTLIQNASQFAKTKVRLLVAWDRERLRLTIADDGPGFDPALLQRLGEPYLSSGRGGRGEGGPHMGLGVFIAMTLLGHSGAKLDFRNAKGGGAEVVISWHLSQFLGQGAVPK